MARTIENLNISTTNNYRYSITVSDSISKTEAWDISAMNNNSTDEMFSDIYQTWIETISSVLCILGLIANALSITATVHIPHRRTMHFKLIISLGISDSVLLAAIFLYNMINVCYIADECAALFAKLMLDVAMLATLINLLLMAVDHYLVITKPLNYGRFMTNYNGTVLILGIWAVSIAFTLLELIVALATMSETPETFCEQVIYDDFELEFAIVVFIFVVLFGISLIYTRIYILVKSIITQDRILHQYEMHNCKAIVTTLLIIGTFVLFWTPHGIYLIYLEVMIHKDKKFVIDQFQQFLTINATLFLILQLNCLADPLIYAFRLRYVQEGYSAVFYKLFPHRRHSINEANFRQRSFMHRRSTIHSRLDMALSSPDDNHGNMFDEHDERRNDEALFICDQQQVTDDTKQAAMNESEK